MAPRAAHRPRRWLRHAAEIPIPPTLQGRHADHRVGVAPVEGLDEALRHLGKGRPLGHASGDEASRAPGVEHEAEARFAIDRDVEEEARAHLVQARRPPRAARGRARATPAGQSRRPTERPSSPSRRVGNRI